MMFVKKAYSYLTLSWRMRFDRKWFLKTVVLLILISTTVSSFGQEEYDEIPVFLDVPHVGGSEITSVINGIGTVPACYRSF